MSPRKVLVTGANGYIGNAVAKAFSRAGWEVYGLIRRAEDALDLSRNEIFPIIGSPSDKGFAFLKKNAVFDVVVSNTEDFSNYTGHLTDVLGMLREIGRRSIDRANIKPLVLFSSGCKDYGRTVNHGDPNLEPHTEDSLLDTPALVVLRAEMSVKLLNGQDHPFDAVVLRPTPLYGYGSCYYGSLFATAERLSKYPQPEDRIVRIRSDPNTILHGCHIDDCAEAYVTLAEYPDRKAISGQAFNISNDRYETIREILDATAKSYGLTVEYDPPAETKHEDIIPGSLEGLVTYSQWVSSEKVRKLTGWTEKRPHFAENIERYRLSYEAAVNTKDKITMRILDLFEKATVQSQTQS